MYEEVDTNGRFLYLSFKTEDTYVCSNYYLSGDFDTEGDDFSFEFHEVLAPEVCLTALGPAYASFKFNNLAIGTYPMEVVINRRKSKGELIVSEDSYELDFSRTKKFDIVDKKVSRTP